MQCSDAGSCGSRATNLDQFETVLSPDKCQSRIAGLEWDQCMQCYLLPFSGETAVRGCVTTGWQFEQFHELLSD